jgi:5-methylthioadenosine/S-adenosylhomocysteine deaminase
MLSADLLLYNAFVLGMDEQYHLFPHGAVAIDGGKILAVGTEADVRLSMTAKDELDCGGKILMPALINAHTHAPMALLRGVADDMRLDVWLLGYIMPVERTFVSPEFVRLGTQLACAEMIRSGTGTFADMYYFEEEVARAASEAGMRALCGQTVLKFPAPDAEAYEDSLARARRFLLQWKDHPLILPCIAPHAPYTCTAEILRACTVLAREFGVPLHIHISETEGEVENARRDWGMPVIPYLRKLGLLEADIVAAHCVHIDEGEIRSLQKAGAGVAHNPSSNLKLASGIAPVARMLDLGLNVGIGTDGAASNNDLDMFEEMRLAALLAKGASGDPTAAPARTALAMATCMGARALHMGRITGSLEVGKRADLLLLDQDGMHCLPRFSHSSENVYSQIVYTAKASDTVSLMVDGRWLMRERKLLTLDEFSVRQHADETAKQIDAFLIQRESSLLSKLVAIETATEEESMEVQVKVELPEGFNIDERLSAAGLEVIRFRHYREFDTYFEFAASAQGRLRYREDQFLDAEGEATEARYRLTLTGPVREREFEHAVVLSRSRFLASASHSLRFYREYFQPIREFEIQKDRLRWLVRRDGIEFFFNLDQILKPDLPGRYLEIKSRTWSRNDAEKKSGLIVEILRLLALDKARTFHEDYAEMINRD